jgi:hypothetical protein
MRMGSSWNKDKLGMDVTAPSPVTAEPAGEVDLSEQNSIVNKARDQAWRIGDQAMKKAPQGSTYDMFRGCFE